MPQEDVLRELDELQSDIVIAICKLSGALYDLLEEDVYGKKITIRNATLFIDYLERTPVDQIIAALPPSSFSNVEQIGRIKDSAPKLRQDLKLTLALHYLGGDPEA
jgi:hypothetical protein